MAMWYACTISYELQRCRGIAIDGIPRCVSQSEKRFTVHTFHLHNLDHLKTGAITACKLDEQV
jgi:hypothetical protein